MKTTLLFTTLLAGLALTGCNKSTRTSTADTNPPPAPEPTTSTTDSLSTKMDRAGAQVADASRNAADKVTEATRSAAASVREAGHDLSTRMSEWRLSKSDIESDVMADRPIVRTRSDVTTPTGAIDTSMIEKNIKSRIQSDSMLSGLKFDVDANKQGEVELSGKARTADQIAQAMATALDTDGVTKVTSKIKIDPNAGMNK